MHLWGKGPQLSLSNSPCNLCVTKKKKSLLYIFLFMITTRTHIKILIKPMMTFPPCLVPLTSALFHPNAAILPDYQTAMRKSRHSMALSASKGEIYVVTLSS